MNKADRFFPDDERAAISAAVARAELKTSGEIVVMVVERSSLYREAAVFGGFVLAGVIAMFIELALNGLMSHGQDWSAAQGAATQWLSAAQTAGLWTFLPILLLAYLPCRILCSCGCCSSRTAAANRRWSKTRSACSTSGGWTGHARRPAC